MKKEQIVNEIRRIAAGKKGKAPGQELFQSLTGIGPGKWRGVFWAKWSDAVKEAGFAPGQWQQAFTDEFLFEKYLGYFQELGRVPTSAELALKRRADKEFPDRNAFDRFGSKQKWLQRLHEYCNQKGKYELVELLRPSLKNEDSIGSDKSDDHELREGYVYLFKSGRFHKIGKSDSPGRREYELGIKLPEKLETIHTIRTDDPSGIEAYWHNRFKDKRGNGEWFKLSAADIAAFKRRKFM